MLLLVLILILIAFGLLVVALLTGSVLWAWVSVAVSAVAALVLVVDALQRRAAVRAGAQAEASSQDRGARQRSYPELDDPVAPEPVTEILPVVAPGGNRSGRPPVSAPDTESYAGPPAPPERKPASDQVGSEQRTQVMGPVQPSGSEARPSGAAGAPPASPSTASPSVIGSGAGSTRSGTPGDTSADAPPSTAASVPAASGPDTSNDATVVVRAHGNAKATAAGPPVEPANGSGPGGSAADSTASSTTGGASSGPADSTSNGTAKSTGSGPAEGRTTPDAPADAPVAPIDVVKAGSSAAGEPAAVDEGAAKATGSTDGAAKQTAGQAAGQATTPAEPPVEEPAADGEPPEETREPAASAVVALLPDEVLVVDEQPRYHVAGCRALTARATIPLPAREAVELGFTPCGWCSPDRTLAERHPARA